MPKTRLLPRLWREDREMRNENEIAIIEKWTYCPKCGSAGDYLRTETVNMVYVDHLRCRKCEEEFTSRPTADELRKFGCGGKIERGEG